MLDFENYDKPIWPKDDTERALIENGRIRDKVHAELAAHAREFQRVFMAPGMPRPLLQTLAEWNADEQYGHEWRLNAARTDEELIAVYQTQLADYAVTKERLATERILRDDAQKQISAQKAQLVQAESNLNATQKMLDATIAERDELHAQITALMTERDTLAAKLDAANAKLAALENAALVVTPDPDTTTHPLVARVAVLDVDTLAPLEALTELLLLKRMLAATPPAMVLAPDDDARPMDREAQRPMTPTFEPPTRKPAA